MDKMLFYKDGQFIGERSKNEIELLAEQNKSHGYEVLIFENIALFEKDPKRLQRARRLISDFKKILDIVANLPLPEYQKEEYRNMNIEFITGRGRDKKKKGKKKK